MSTNLTTQTPVQTALLCHALADRFWAKVNKTETCWLWTGSIQSVGYGQIGLYRVNGKNIRELAHRVSYEMRYGPIPPENDVLHDCDKLYPVGDVTYRHCVRPDHLYLGNQQDNILDMFKKRRKATKLDFVKAAEIRAKYADGGYTYGQLAVIYGVSFATIHEVVANQTWRTT